MMETTDRADLARMLQSLTDAREVGMVGAEVDGKIDELRARLADRKVVTVDEIAAGTPATIHFYTDSSAAVVVRRTAKRVYIAPVETTNERHEREIPAGSGELPVTIADGVLDKPLPGAVEIYTLYVDREGKPYATRGDKSIRVRFGYSRRRIDYKG